MLGFCATEIGEGIMHIHCHEPPSIFLRDLKKALSGREDSALIMEDENNNRLLHWWRRWTAKRRACAMVKMKKAPVHPVVLPR